MTHENIAPLSKLYERHSSKWRRFPSDVLPMHVAEMDFEIAEPIKRVLIEMVSNSDIGYLGPTPEIADAFEGFALRHWGWQIDKKQLRLATDVGVATVEYLRYNLKPGERVIITTPVYNGFHHWLEELHVEPVQVDLLRAGNVWSLDLDAIEEQFKAGNTTILLSNPHNPTGTAFTREELTALAAIARKHGATVISDEIHAPLTHSAKFTPFLDCGEDAREVGICITSSSKSFNLAGLKIAFALTQSVNMNEKAAKLPEAAHWRSSILGAFAMASAFSEGDEWLAQTNETIRENAEHLVLELARLLPEIKTHVPDASYLAWLDLSDFSMTTEEIFEKAKVAFVPGPDMGGEAFKNFARMNIGTSKEIITAALERIAAAR